MHGGWRLHIRRWLALAARCCWRRSLSATLVPVGWQIRLGLHWLVEHFLAYFAVTSMFCLAWPRPMAVAAVLLPVAVLLETAQGLTPDRTADLRPRSAPRPAWRSAALLADLAWPAASGAKA